MKENMTEVYKKLHSSPAEAGKIPPHRPAIKGMNPMCGDTVELYLDFLPPSETLELAYRCRGCTICRKSLALLRSLCLGLPRLQAREEAAHIFAALSPQRGDLSSLPAGELKELAQSLKAFPTRSPCLRLPWQTLLRALKDPS